MADRGVALTAVKGGITRLRTKGAALNDSLYDLLNGYVTAARTVKVRPGTFRRATLPVSDTTGLGLTKGLCAFDGNLHVFATESVTVPAGYQVHVIQHPAGLNIDGTQIPLVDIHFAAPFMGFLYVVAEFEPADTLNELGSVFHYWLQTGTAWKANTVYKLGDIVTPATPNGFSYQATRLSAPNASWAPEVPREIGDVVEPTEYNDFYYTVVDVQGTNPRSGATEPDWPVKEGEQLNEDAEGSYSETGGAAAQPNVSQNPNPVTVERYEGGL